MKTAVLWAKGVWLALFMAVASPLYSADKTPHAEAIARAEAAMAASDYGKAREILAESLKKDPGEPYLTYNVALTHYAEGDYAKAQGLFQAADLASKDDQLRALILAQLGNVEAHLGRAQLKENRALAIDHFRRAHQIYQAALNGDSGQKIARSNQEPVTEGLVKLIVERADNRLQLVRNDRQVQDRIEKLMSNRGDLQEALQLDPRNERALSLQKTSEGALADNLQELGDKSLNDAKGKVERARAGSDGRKPGGLLNDALISVRQAEDAYRDGLTIHPEAAQLKAKLDEAIRFSALILLELGKEALANAEKEKRLPEKVRKYETAVSHFEEVLQVEPKNAEAQKLIHETRTKLADLLEKEGDEAVAQAERIDKAKADALWRERADDSYTKAAELNPDDAELQDKMKDNAVKLAKALQETGDSKLERGKELIEKAPDKAVANLEDALNDFTKATQLLEEHGEPADKSKGAMEEAGKMLAEQGGQKPGKGEESKPGDDKGDPKPGEPAMADKGKGKAPKPGEEPGQPGPPGAKPGQQPGGPSMKDQLAQSSEQATSLLQQARALAAAEEPAKSPGDKGGTGAPSYETVAYVAKGSDFNKDPGGGSNEREGNFNTQAMNRPARDW